MFDIGVIEIFSLTASKCANFPCVLTKYQSKYSAIFYTGQELVNLAVSLCFFVLVRRNTAAVTGIGATHNANMQVCKKILHRTIF
jgi:hypothetical protein